MRIISRNSNPRYNLTINNINQIGTRIKVESLIVPDTYYNIPENVILGFEGETFIGTVTIGAGNYSADAFMAQLTTQMTSLDTPTYTYALNPIDLQYTITSTSLAVYILTIPPTSLLATYFSIKPPAGIFTSNLSFMNLGILDFTRTRTFRVYSGLQNNTTYLYESDRVDSITSQTTIEPNILIDTPSIGQYLPDFNVVNVQYVPNNFYMQLTDDKGFPIDTNGFPWELIIYFY